MAEDWKSQMRCESKVYNGDRIIQKILEELGTTENIAKNPYVIEKVNGMLYEIMLQRGFEISGVKVEFGTLTGECEETEIEKIVRLLTNNEEKAENVLVNEDDEIVRGTEYSISVNSSTQELTLLTKMKVPSCKKQQLIIDTFRDLGGEEGVGETIERNEGWQKTKINPYGIVMERKWNEKPGEKAVKMRRMPDAPVIIEITDSEGVVQYCTMNIEQIPSLMGNNTNFFPGTLELLRKRKEIKSSPQEVKNTNMYKCVVDSGKLNRSGRYNVGMTKLYGAAGIRIDANQPCV